MSSGHSPHDRRHCLTCLHQPANPAVHSYPWHFLACSPLRLVPWCSQVLWTPALVYLRSQELSPQQKTAPVSRNHKKTQWEVRCQTGAHKELNYKAIPRYCILGVIKIFSATAKLSSAEGDGSYTISTLSLPSSKSTFSQLSKREICQ